VIRELPVVSSSENIGDVYLRAARDAARRPALRVHDGVLTHAALAARVQEFAGALRARGLEAGDRLALVLPNGPDYITSVLGCALARVVVVPTDPRLAASEVEPRLRLAGCRWLLRPDGWHQLDAGGHPPLDAWAIAYTSGSTGEPKGAVISHRAKLFSAIVEAQEYGCTRDTTVLINTPLFHVHALVHAFTVLLRGGALSVAAGFDPAGTLALIRDHRVTDVSMVPTMYQALLDQRPDRRTLRRLRVARCTGAPMSGDVRAAVLEHFGHALHILYGATEAGGISNLRPQDVPAREGSVGRPFLGVDVDVRNGVLSIRSPYQFSGYLGGTPHRPGEDWLTLSDLADLDADGFIYLRGRADDVIISGGENIAPSEVEDVLRSHPAVADAAVLGLPDERWGQVVAAFLVLREGGEIDVDGFLEGRLARFKRPRRVFTVPAIPRNAMGKVDRAALAAGPPRRVPML
jgi:acyl-CoA synthetase (AMP-forming)/AMP-acid ligase II